MEGNLAGNRAAHLTRKREAEQQKFEERKQKIKKDVERGKQSMATKFDNNSTISMSEKTFRDATVGLVGVDASSRSNSILDPHRVLFLVAAL